ncbi:MAG: TIM barrel protein [Pseudomonadota bacterium]
MTRFSANLGFLWTELTLPEAIRAAARAGFDAVECHWPYETPPEDVAAALSETGLPMLGINIRRGDVTAGDMGLSALAGRENEARAAINEAVHYAAAIGARCVHVMAGFAEGAAAGSVFERNLNYACDQAGQHGLTVLIEPLNPHDAPGYYLSSTDQAAEIIRSQGCSNLKLMFDCYHVQRAEGDVVRRLGELLPIIGHIQFAGAPDRGPPGQGELNYRYVFERLRQFGYDAPLGAEYRPGGDTEASLGWMDMLK